MSIATNTNLNPNGANSKEKSTAIEGYELFKLLQPSTGKRPYKGETAIHVEIADYLKAASLEGKLKAVWFHIPNSISSDSNPRYGKQLADMGKIKGAPDLAFLAAKDVLLMEIKTYHGHLSPEQLLFQKWCTTAHVPYVTVRSLEEVKKELTKAGLVERV